MELMQARDTPTCAASSACDHSFSARSTRNRVFTLHAPQQTSAGRRQESSLVSTGQSRRPERRIVVQQGGAGRMPSENRTQVSAQGNQQIQIQVPNS